MPGSTSSIRRRSTTSWSADAVDGHGPAEMVGDAEMHAADCGAEPATGPGPAVGAERELESVLLFEEDRRGSSFPVPAPVRLVHGRLRRRPRARAR